MGDHITDTCDLLVVPVSDLRVKIDTQLGEDLPRRAATDTEDIGKAYLSSFVVSRSHKDVLYV